MKKNLSQLLVVALLFLPSCSYLMEEQEVQALHYLKKAPKADIRKFFKGNVEAFAVTRDENDKIISAYKAKMHGKWEGNKGVLKQDFVYNDGKRDSRTWLITFENSGAFSAVGHDVLSPAKGRHRGNVIEMLYSLSLKKGSAKQEVKFEDNFYLVDRNSMIGISVMKVNSKIIGESTISYKKAARSVRKSSKNSAQGSVQNPTQNPVL